MHLVLRPAWVFAAVVVLPLCAGAETQSEYKQTDTNYYLRSELFAADPAAPVVTPETATNIGGSYLIATRGQAPQVVYLQEAHDWIEPITPPSEPASLNIAPTAMQVREPQGGVQVALPSAPADFRDVERGMALPNGAVLRTGDSGSVAVLFGGVDSVRLAPNTQAAVQMNLAGGVRDVEIDVRSGMVFSKVGQRPGERQAYAVHTPFGIASAHGTDYVTVVFPQRVDVWVAQGVVALDSPGGPVQTTTSNGIEPLKVMHFPVPKDPATAMAESAESLTALLNFIPLANQKLQALVVRTHSGAHLTPTEKNYVSRIRKVVALIKLADVNAPAIAAAAPVTETVIVKHTPPPMPPPRAQLVSLPPLSLTPLQASASAKPAKAKAIAPVTPAIAKHAGGTAVASQQKPAAKAVPYKTKPVVIVLPPAHFPKTAPETDHVTALADKPAKAKKMAKASKPASAKHETPAVAAETDKEKSPHYLRAQPVNPADLVEAPTVNNVPPPSVPPPPAPPETSPASAEADPNSLGAPLNPMRAGYPVLAPRPPEPDASATIGTPATGASNSAGY